MRRGELEPWLEQIESVPMVKRPQLKAGPGDADALLTVRTPRGVIEYEVEVKRHSLGEAELKLLLSERKRVPEVSVHAPRFFGAQGIDTRIRA
jgi:hypothetical protein